jgi:serine/threonine protein kinase
VNSDARNWQRVKDIFDAALAHAGAERDSFVRERCGEDLALAREVGSLLAAHQKAGSFAERAPLSSLPFRPALEAGAVLGVYRITGPLDAGGMGEVFRAVDTRLHREVAVKVLPDLLSDDAGRIARLEREARVLAALKSPYIATIHGLEVDGAVRAIVMELIEGPTLAGRLRRGHLSLEQALTIARQIAAALEAAHSRDIVHRDLKPANIKVSDAGAVKVLDFGLSKSLHAPEDGEMTPAPDGTGSIAGIITGTPGYMSPEQARGASLDTRTDIWAFGCVLYEMLTGTPAFAREILGESAPPDWQRLPSQVPPAIRRLLGRCLQADPTRRLQHIGDARIEIDDVIQNRDIVDEAPPRRFGFTMALISLCAIVAAFAGWKLQNPTAQPERRVVEIDTPRTFDLWSFALSPDGRSIAYVGEDRGQSMLWVRTLDVANGRVLAGTENARRPFWSPDNRSIGFFSNSELKRVDAAGGAVHVITRALGGTTAAWGPADTILFSGADMRALRSVNAAGGEARVVTTPPPDSTGHRHPQFLPDGRFIFFSGGAQSVRGVYLGAFDDKSARKLVASDTQAVYVAPGWLLFGRQGSLLAQSFDPRTAVVSGEPRTIAESVAVDPLTGAGAFSASQAETLVYRTARPAATRLSWYGRSGTLSGTVGTAEQSGLSNIQLSPDDRSVVVERTLGNETDLWLLDALHQTRFTRASDARIERLPLWSPDGRRIAFESVSAGLVSLAIKSVDGGEERTLVESAPAKIPCDWSPDGKYLLYYVPNPDSGTDLWLLPLDTGVPRLFLSTPANELWGQFSPDGHWVAYQSNDTGRYEIYVRAFEGHGAAIPVSSDGGVYPRWSRDGGEIYFVAPNAKLMAARVHESEKAFAADTPAGLFQTQRVGGGMNVISRGQQYDVGADGRFLINDETDSRAPAITLLLNWRP